MVSAAKNEALRLERAATAEKLASEFDVQDGERRIKRGLCELSRTMNSEAARERSKYLDRRIREAAGLDVEPIADAAPEHAEGIKERLGGRRWHNPESAYWDGRLIKKRRTEPMHRGPTASTAAWERKLQGGFKEPPVWTRRKKEKQS
jgi:hypothetical protein